MSDTERLLAEALHAAGVHCTCGRDGHPCDMAGHRRDAEATLANLPAGLVVTTEAGLSEAIRICNALEGQFFDAETGIEVELDPEAAVPLAVALREQARP
jgi:hypothetical protein